MSTDLSKKRMRVMTCFIEATERLVTQDSIDGLCIRKIASEAGYNSATLYNYFEDLEHLILFASVHYLREYVNALAINITHEMTILEKYRTIYKTFNYYAFRSPEVFYNMFFGKYSHRLSQVITQYYQMFPSDLEQHSEMVKMMLLQGTMPLRDSAIMKELVQAKYVDKEKSQKTIEIIVRTQQSYLYEILMKGDKVDEHEHNEKFLSLFDYIMSTAR